MRQVIMPLIPAGELVFDIGANIGQYTVIFGESGQVIAVEPDYKNFAFLQFNVLINRCSNVQFLWPWSTLHGIALVPKGANRRAKERF